MDEHVYIVNRDERRVSRDVVKRAMGTLTNAPVAHFTDEEREAAKILARALKDAMNPPPTHLVEGR